MDKIRNRPILLVEDNEDDIELTIHAFNKQKILNKLDIVRDGKEALDYLFCIGNYKDRNINDKPLLILLDIGLPELNGIEVLKKIRENNQTKYLPVVILTTSKNEQDLINAYKLSTNSYIRKPVDFNKFAEVTRKLCMYWILNEPMPDNF